tara:strand:+ start:340 stop:837 length:498 start_codon:yes stop_codon:yes gene_type:complete
MDNISEYLVDYTFDKIGNIDEEISIYHGLKNYKNNISRIVYLTSVSGDIVGYFSIEGEGVNHQFDSGKANQLNIEIEDNYQGKGFTKILMKNMIEKIYEDIPEMIGRGDQMLFIDTDASDGFWDRIGMIESQRYGYDRIPKYADREGAGYEKYITLHKLHKYSLS